MEDKIILKVLWADNLLGLSLDQILKKEAAQQRILGR